MVGIWHKVTGFSTLFLWVDYVNPYTHEKLFVMALGVMTAGLQLLNTWLIQKRENGKK